MIILWFFCFYSCVLKSNNSKKYQKRKTQVLNWRKVGPIGEDENTIALINITQEDESNIFELLQNLWINNLPSPPLLTQPPPLRLLVFDIFSNHSYFSRNPVY